MKTSFYLLPIVAVIAAVRIIIRVRRRAARQAQAQAGTGSGDAAVGPAGGLATADRVSARIHRLGGDVALVAWREVRERVKGRTFRVGTLIILLVVAAAVTIPVLRKGGTATDKVGVVGTLSAPLRLTVVATGRAFSTKIVLTDEASEAAAKSALRAGRIQLAIIDAQRLIVNQAISSTDTSTGSVLVRTIASSVALQGGLEAAGIPPLDAARLAHPPPLPVESLQPVKHNDTARTTALYGLILTYVLLTQYGTWLLMGVVEEKSSRVAEVLLSTLRPGQLLGGKVLGIGTVAMLQTTLIVGVALGLGAALGSDLLHGTAPLGVVGALIWVVLGYAFYCWVYAAGGSLADRQEQVQSLAFPLQLPILFGYIVSFTALGNGSPSTLIKVLAYLPPTAPFAMSVLFGVGDVGWWQFALSALLTVAATVLMARGAAAVYKRAILRTGGRLHLRDVVGAEALST